MPVNSACRMVIVIVITIDKGANSEIHSTIEKANDNHQNH